MSRPFRVADRPGFAGLPHASFPAQLFQAQSLEPFVVADPHQVVIHDILGQTEVVFGGEPGRVLPVIGRFQEKGSRSQRKEGDQRRGGSCTLGTGAKRANS